MFCKFPPIKTNLNVSFLALIFSILITGGCAVEASKSGDEKSAEKALTASEYAAKNAKGISPSKNRITIEPDSPADTVRVFYKNLREKRFREALFLTNLRPAIEGLTDAELKDLQVDFGNLARQIPADVGINGEIISGDDATVTVKLPDNKTDKLKLQELRLKRAGGVWTILTVEESAEKIIKREGKNYFFNLKIETHQAEAKNMLNGIAKAQMIYAAQTGGLYGEMPVLIEKGFLPADALSPDSTGYNYKISLSADRKRYGASAEPAVYGKTGKLSFGFEVENNRTSNLKSVDTKGQPFGG
ncbi:MAG: hypothetical protein M3525_04915 [Acidobacteriota bacterium]|nr:hypothetical protein [Acidobacteriota bacterium]